MVAADARLPRRTMAPAQAGPGAPSMVSRAQRTALANWWWTVDRWLIAALCVLVVAGMILTMAASPPVAERIGPADLPLRQPPGRGH